MDRDESWRVKNGSIKHFPPHSPRFPGRLVDGSMDTSRQPCKYFQQGSCKYGKECMYSHDPIVNKLSDVRPGRVGYRPKYPNMTLDNQFRGNESATAPPKNNGNFGQKAEPPRPFGSAPTEHSLSDRRPGRAGYKPTYNKKSSSPTRTRSTSISSHVNKTTSNQPANTGTGGKKKKRGGKKGKGKSQAPANQHDNTFDDRRLHAIQATVGRSLPSQQQQQQQQQNQVTPEQVIQHDLTNVQPQWMFSCYGISTDWTIAGNIIEGVDYSPEELRLQALSEWKNTGSIQQYMNDVQQLKMYVENKRQSVLFNPTAALSEAISRRLALPPGTVLPLQPQQMLPPQNQVNLTVNPTLHAQPLPAQPAGMQDDQLGSFHLGAVPLEPPI